MEIIVKGRHTGVSDRFRDHVNTKLARIERLDHKLIRVDVEVSKESNPRIVDQRERVELTIHSPRARGSGRGLGGRSFRRS